MAKSKDIYHLGEKTREIRATEINLLEDHDYHDWLKEISKHKKFPKHIRGMIKTYHPQLSKAERLISVLTYDIMNKTRGRNFMEISSAVYALMPLYINVFNAQQGKDSWIKKDILFNAVTGAKSLIDLFDIFLGNKTLHNVLNEKEPQRNQNTIEHVIGYTIARAKLDWSYPNVIRGRIYIYAKAEQILKGSIYEVLKVIARNKLKNITFIITANENISKTEYIRMLDTFLINNIDFTEHKPIQQVSSELKKLAKKSNSSALILRNPWAFDTHWEYVKPTESIVTNRELKHLKKHYGFEDVSIETIDENIEIALLRKTLRRRIINNYASWAEKTSSKDVNNVLKQINKNWNIPTKTELKKLVNYKKDKSLSVINKKIINTLKEKNEELIVNNTLPSIAGNISNGISMFGLRSIIQTELLTSEGLLQQLRESKKLDNGIVVNLFYDRTKIDGVKISDIINSYKFSFADVYCPANAYELIEAWSESLKNKKNPHIIIIDRAVITNNKQVASKTIGKPKDGGYIIRKRKVASKPVDYIFYGSGTIINEIEKVTIELEKETKLNIQVVSLPVETRMSVQLRNKLLPKTIKKVEFITTGNIRRSHLELVNKKYAKAFITPETWRTSAYIKEIRKVLKE